MQKFTLSLALIVLAITPGCFDKNKAPEAKNESSATAVNANDQEFNDNIVKLIKVSKVRENILKDFDTYIEQIKKAPGAEEAMVNSMSTKLHTLINSEESLKNISAAYAKHLSNADAVALIAFYNTPAGQKWSDVASSIQQEVMVHVMQGFQTIMMEEMQAKAAKAPVPATSKAATSANHAK